MIRRNIFFRSLSLLSAVLVMSMCFGITASAASPKLNRSKISIITGSSVRLKVSGTSSDVKWSSTDTSVCTVSSGKITAVSEGSASVIASVGGVKLRCSVTVYDSFISSPKPLTLRQGSSGKVSLTLRGVKSYEIESLSTGSAASLSSVNLNGDKLVITFRGVSEGTSVFRIFDADNSKMSRKIIIKVVSADSGDEDALIVDEASHDEYIEEVCRLVNEERAAFGLAPLTLDSTLCEIAQIRAEEIGNDFSHVRPDGSSVFDLMDTMGIRYHTAGENIARGQRSPASAVSSWMSSEKHRKNILSDSFTNIGIGYDSASRCWVQVFTG